MKKLKEIESKIIDWKEIGRQTDLWKKNDRKIVFTNGCFDILHYGHIHYLSQAKDLGDFLIIGLNSDNSVKRLKGNNRPINTSKTRSHLLAALSIVDAVVFFEEDTPLGLIRTIMPDILVKGGDYKAEEIVGYKEVMSNGGRVEILSFVDGYSTTAIERKIKKGH